MSGPSPSLGFEKTSTTTTFIKAKGRRREPASPPPVRRGPSFDPHRGHIRPPLQPPRPARVYKASSLSPAAKLKSAFLCVEGGKRGGAKSTHSLSSLGREVGGTPHLLKVNLAVTKIQAYLLYFEFRETDVALGRTHVDRPAIRCHREPAGMQSIALSKTLKPTPAPGPRLSQGGEGAVLEHLWPDPAAACRAPNRRRASSIPKCILRARVPGRSARSGPASKEDPPLCRPRLPSQPDPDPALSRRGPAPRTRQLRSRS